MSATVFENNLDIEVHLTLNGKLKAVLSPGDTIAIDVPAGARVGYGTADAPAARPALSYTVPTSPSRSLVTAAAAPAPGQGSPGFRPQAAKAPRPITQYKDGVKVQTLHSVQSASRVAGVQYYDFLKALQRAGETGFTHGEFCYKYASADEVVSAPSVPAVANAAPAEKRRRKSGKPVVQMALDGTHLRVWPSQAIAADTLKINASSISKVCHNQWESAGGFGWKLAKASA